MQILPLDSKTKALNEELEAAGVVVRHVVVDAECSSPAHAEHRQAIINAIEEETEEIARQSPAWAAASGSPIVNYLKANVMRGRVITTEQFLGRYWDNRRKALILRGHSPRYQNSYFVAQDAEVEVNIVSPDDDLPDEFGAGYVYAFTEPPYPLCSPKERALRLPKAQTIELFASAVEHFLPGLFQTGPVLYQWPGDWSRYFDAGNDWWGAFAWTYQRARGEITAVFASATD